MFVKGQIFIYKYSYVFYSVRLAVWSPFKVRDIEKIENVQRRATKQVPTLNNMEYNERLKKLKMPTLKYRRMPGDIFQTG
jgi:4-hydroxy-3-methylbut-2-en-1-yl diphosphate synthase IspG/GcpE